MGDIDFEVISNDENSNKFQKPRFWKEKSVENVVTHIILQMSSEALVTAGSIITLTLKEPGPQGSM